MKTTAPYPGLTRLAVPLFVALLLNACAPVSTKPQATVAESAQTRHEHTSKTEVKPETPLVSNNALLDYAQYFTDLPADTQKKEVAILSTVNGKEKLPLLTRSKLAIAYALPSSKTRDSQKAQILLDELLTEKTLSADEKNLFGLLRDFVGENIRLVSRLRDEQKRTETAQTGMMNLQKKLDDLKDIEKTMIDRDQGPKK
ncbi:hypothetical protein [Methylovorus mays]|uniref:hypothetical protein n=1 Tax=Methylovorus mays TaxID=184077 RepID=UPI001E43B2F9|nr:hypothetical protein [Methylovorus mays]MCB5207365.1 hypothetical protein [Methylovorus mays]